MGNIHSVCAVLDPAATMDVTESNQLSSLAEVPLPLTSSTAFRTQFTSKQACDVYEGRLAYIRAKREPYCDGMEHDFKNHATIIPKLRELAFFAATQVKDAESAVNFQKTRHSDLEEQERTAIEQYESLEEAMHLKLWYWHGQCPGMLQLCDSRVVRLRVFLREEDYSHEATLYGTDEDRDFLDWVDKQLLKLELQASTEKDIQLHRELLNLKLSSFLLEARFENSDTLDSIWRQQSLGCETKPWIRDDISHLKTEYPAYLDQFDILHTEHITKLFHIHQARSNASNKIEGFLSSLKTFRAYEKWCKRDADFAESLSHFTGPLRFLDFPREIRDEVYGLVLSFDYNVSDTRKLTCIPNTCPRHALRKKCDNGCVPKDHAVLWSHPLFRTSRSIRKESSEQFYKRNSFATRSLSTLCTPTLPADFRNLIADLSVTWPSLGVLSCETLKALKLFKGLRYLKIYLNWEQLRNRSENTLDGISSLEFLVNHFQNEVASIDKVEIFEFRLRRHEQERLVRIMDEIRWSQDGDYMLFGKESYSDFYEEYSSPVEARGYNLSERAILMEENYDKAVSARILAPQTPGTRFNGVGRWPQKPSSAWSAWDSRQAHKDLSRGREYVPLVCLVKRDVAISKLEEIRAIVAERRLQHIERVAVETARRREWIACRAAEREVDSETSRQADESAEESFDLINDEVNNDQGSTDNDSNDHDSTSKLEQEVCRYLPPTIVDTSDLESFWGAFDSFFEQPLVNDSEEDVTVEEVPTEPPISFFHTPADPDSLEGFWGSFDALLAEELEQDRIFPSFWI